MPKAYFRLADGKAFSKEITSEVNYDKALNSITKAFRLPKKNIRLVYVGEVQTSNFNLNPEIPHHIVHIVDKSKIANEEINLSLTVNVDGQRRNVANIKTKSKSNVKDLLGQVLEMNGINKGNLQAADVFHRGSKLTDDDTFLDKGVQNDDGLNINLKVTYIDAFDVPAVTSELVLRVDNALMIVKAKPEFLPYLKNIEKASNALFFHKLQQAYEVKRPNVVYQEVTYIQSASEPGKQKEFGGDEEEVNQEKTEVQVE